MIQIIAGTNRPEARSLAVAKISQSLFEKLGVESEVLDLSKVPLNELNGTQYSENQPESFLKYKAKVNAADGLLVVCPEYNGSMPGALKYFIDHWSYPETFEFRPVAFIGLGGRFGGLRPVEHLQQVFGYRNAFVYPERVFISNVWSVLQDGQIKDELVAGLLSQQAAGFANFIEALKAKKLDANSR